MNPNIIRIEEGDGFTRTYLSQYPDEQAVALARETLKKLEGDVLLEGTFDGDTWVMTDGKLKALLPVRPGGGCICQGGCLVAWLHPGGMR